MIRFLIDFDRFWRHLGAQVGCMLEPCWPQNLQKGDIKTKTKKRPQKRGAEENAEGVLGIFNTTENNLQYRDTRGENTPSQLALWRISRELAGQPPPGIGLCGQTARFFMWTSTNEAVLMSGFPKRWIHAEKVY